MSKFLKCMVILVLFLCFGCERDYLTEPQSGKYSGTWCWVKTVGGIAGVETKPEAGTKIIRQYKSDIFRLYRNGTLKVLAKYTIDGQKWDLDQIRYSDIQTFDYQFGPEVEYARLDSNTLQIWDGFMDGYFSYFTRD